MQKNGMKPTHVSTNFLVTLLTVAMLTAGIIALFNLVVNPFRLYFPNQRSTLAVEKPRPEQYQQQIRTQLAIRTPSDVLILGNSTFEIGINPDDKALVGLNQSIFNHAIAGHSIQEASDGLPDILKIWTPKTVIVNVAFADLLIGGKANDMPVLSATKPNLFFPTLFSVDTTLASINSLLIPYRKYPETLTAKGHNPMRNFDGSAKASGYHVLFETANFRIERMWKQFANGNGTPSFNNSKNYAELRALIDRLMKENITVILVLSPLHHDYKVNVYKHGLGSRYEAWKQEISSISNNYSHLKNKVKLYDFSCVGKALRESVPERNDKSTPMQFYWDAEHFKSELGTELLSLILKPNLNGDQFSTNLTGYQLPASDWPKYHQICKSSVP